MARNQIMIETAPDDIWRLLEDAHAYPRWVVGADRTVDVDEQWPAPGSAFRVRLAFGKVDVTEMKAVVPGKKVVLHAGTVLGPARVTIELEPRPGGTCVTLIEDPAGKVAPMRLFPPVHLAIKLRNVESLRRLRQLALHGRAAIR